MSLAKHCSLGILCTGVATGIFSCCTANYKCASDFNTASFRILSSGGNDLVFGAGGIYRKDSIRFFSLKGTDTIFHNYGAGANPTPGSDSLLYVTFDYRKLQEVYIKLSSTDIDTLQLEFATVDASPCCPDYSTVQPVTINGRNPESLPGNISVIRK